MGHNVVWSNVSQPTFWRNISPLIFRVEDQAKQETSKQSSVPAKHGLTFIILCNIIFQKIEIFIATDVRTATLTSDTIKYLVDLR